MINIFEGLIGTLGQMLDITILNRVVKLDGGITYRTCGVSCITQKDDSLLEPRFELRSIVETILYSVHSKELEVHRKRELTFTIF